MTAQTALPTLPADSAPQRGMRPSMRRSLPGSTRPTTWQARTGRWRRRTPSANTLFSTAPSIMPTPSAAAFLALRQDSKPRTARERHDWIAGLRRSSRFQYAVRRRHNPASSSASKMCSTRTCPTRTRPATRGSRTSSRSGWTPLIRQARRPSTSRQITGPGLAGGGFYLDANGACPRLPQTVALSPIADMSFNAPDFTVIRGVERRSLLITLSASGACAVHGLGDGPPHRRRRHLHGDRFAGRCSDAYQPGAGKRPPRRRSAVTDPITLYGGRVHLQPDHQALRADRRGDQRVSLRR